MTVSDFITIIGFSITLLGFAATLWQIHETKSVAKSASDSGSADFKPNKPNIHTVKLVEIYPTD